MHGKVFVLLALVATVASASFMDRMQCMRLLKPSREEVRQFMTASTECFQQADIVQAVQSVLGSGIAARQFGGQFGGQQFGGGRPTFGGGRPQSGFGRPTFGRPQSGFGRPPFGGNQGGFMAVFSNATGANLTSGSSSPFNLTQNVDISQLLSQLQTLLSSFGVQQRQFGGQFGGQQFGGSRPQQFGSFGRPQSGFGRPTFGRPQSGFGRPPFGGNQGGFMAVFSNATGANLTSGSSSPFNLTQNVDISQLLSQLQTLLSGFAQQRHFGGRPSGFGRPQGGFTGIFSNASDFNPFANLTSGFSSPFNLTQSFDFSEFFSQLQSLFGGNTRSMESRDLSQYLESLNLDEAASQFRQCVADKTDLLNNGAFDQQALVDSILGKVEGTSVEANVQDGIDNCGQVEDFDVMTYMKCIKGFCSGDEAA